MALDSDTRSPLFKRIKRFGVTTPGRSNEIITQATFVESLLSYITSEPKIDRDRFLRGKSLDIGSPDLIFRRLFINNDDIEIAATIFNYFKAVEERWPEWRYPPPPGLMLNRSSGFKALMKVLRPIHQQQKHPESKLSVEIYSNYFRRIPEEFRYFDVERYRPGTSGEAMLARDFIGWMDLGQRML